MAVADFCALSPDEFTAACQARRKEKEADTRDAWERMRLLAAIDVQPHVRRRLTPRQLLPLPWDAPRKAETPPAAPQLTKEQRHAALLRALERAGMGKGGHREGQDPKPGAYPSEPPTEDV